jgi:hypothetical protein
MMLRIRTFLIVLLGLASSLACAEDCALSIDPSSSLEFNLNQAYLDALAQSNGTATAKSEKTLTIKNEGTTRCSFFLTIKPTDDDQKLSLKVQVSTASTVKQQNIDYSITHENNEILGGVEASDGVKATGADQVISGSVEPNSSARIPLVMALKTNDFSPSGQYSSGFDCTLYEGEFRLDGALNKGRLQGVGKLEINDVMKISLTDLNADASTGGVLNPEHTVDLGELKEDYERAMTLHIHTNNGYKVNFASENMGKLVHTDSAKSNQNIDYTMKVNGGVVTFPGSGSASQDPNQVHLAKDSGTVIKYGDDASKHTLSFKVSDPKALEDKLAGEYKDVITVTVQSQR